MLLCLFPWIMKDLNRAVAHWDIPHILDILEKLKKNWCDWIPSDYYAIVLTPFTDARMGLSRIGSNTKYKQNNEQDVQLANQMSCHFGITNRLQSVSLKWWLQTEFNICNRFSLLLYETKNRLIMFAVSMMWMIMRITNKYIEKVSRDWLITQYIPEILVLLIHPGKIHNHWEMFSMFDWFLEYKLFILTEKSINHLNNVALSVALANKQFHLLGKIAECTNNRHVFCAVKYWMIICFCFRFKRVTYSISLYYKINHILMLFNWT